LITHGLDDEFHDWVIQQGEVKYPKLGNFLGDGWTQAGAALGTFAAGIVTGNATVERVGNDLVRGQLLNAVMTSTVKVATHRDRPSGGPHSFPSGHTSAMVTTAVVLQEHFGWKAGVPAYTLAGIVAWSRMRGEHHWLSDVVMGATIGTIAGRTVTIDRRRQWTVVPAVAPDRAALYVLWTP
jgi:membrane-associated phospholipid phosphatase